MTDVFARIVRVQELLCVVHSMRPFCRTQLEERRNKLKIVKTLILTHPIANKLLHETRREQPQARLAATARPRRLLDLTRRLTALLGL